MNLTKKTDLNYGYNPTGNLVLMKILKILPPALEKEYREEFSKLDKESYKEFLQYEEEFHL